ncbi:MAG TPA: alkene reductase [Rhodocyclaceae bacterium]|nr:MAG: alkene reductase [Betaproteobacteria bacterium CG2_30_68_42]PIV72029.1 MAG: alkene reductase [Rhodocyclales bacterium CG17_big_fil_post_rev_8_21_14_2_50_68_7]PIX75482.1 MAG: alkene reductase [Rhodocyclales bacterium CG_4_10_14_3_um_filter_68_10]PJA56440.1 MAG: alkene reductase [Rhodocyclales bacterium CG_4_9_14_3_um_filter_68_10]HCX34848.1 alkene reductase [Rhodocyclaceae bacterium]
MSDLLTPVRLGALELANRIVMAPLTRCRAPAPDYVPNELMARYYAQRAGAGLIVSEGTIVSPQGRGYPDTPGIWSQAQVEGWRRVTDAVHAAGGRIVCQLWHCGRLSLPDYHGGEAPVAPSAIDPRWKMLSPAGPKPTVTPRALSGEEIAGIVADFARAGRNAMAAGFDGVEVHASNGYLFHQFFARCSNTRTDAYGGSHENRARLLFEVLDALGRVLPSDRIGVRINPMMNRYHGIAVDADTVPMFEYIVDRLNGHGLAYLHLTEPFQPGQLDGVADALHEVAPHFRSRCKAPIVSNGGFDPARAQDWIARGLCDAVAFGRAFIANPDLPSRIRHGAALAQPDTKTFYQGGEKGYTDYPALDVCAA